MKTRNFLTSLLLSLLVSGLTAQTPTAHFDMSITSAGDLVEEISGARLALHSQLPVYDVESPIGRALRFDGYSAYAQGNLPTSGFSTSALSVSITLAAETYPMMNVNEAEQTPTYTAIYSNLDEGGKRGLALELSSQGDLRFRFGSAYANGYLFTIAGNRKLPLGHWANVTVTLDKSANVATMYLNGESIGTCRMSRSDIVHADATFFIGKDAHELKSGPFLINTFCGLIDDIAFLNEIVTPESAANELPDFNYPQERYAESLWRPQFHGMPSGSWTNESHGMTYSNGRYHVFFQKNANGPYMARLHWGHISSENLCEWHEEPIALTPGEAYDIKGCWSGCVFSDNALTGGQPHILYTAVDNAKAVIAEARSKDENLTEWEKLGVVINGRPNGLSDDFRDPYFFTANGQQYIIVGTSKNGIGACTLHQYNNGTWSNDGTLFFQGTSATQHGTFWEMPNVTPMGDGQYLFTCTPLGTSVGVRTLCWVGTISSEGKFQPSAAGVQYLEMGGISRDGYGLLSPTIYQHDGKTLLLGIVPDKLPTQTNYEMGWAHNFSLPRELTVATDGSLVQKPYSGLTAMRSSTSVEKDLNLTGSASLSPIEGRQLELRGQFKVAGGKVGFNFLKSGSQQASLLYDCNLGQLTLDLSQLARTTNDNNVYNGVYNVSLPKKVATGEVLTLHVFLDGSIADIFVNDCWAFSTRLFPTDVDATGVEVTASVATDVHVQGWTLDASGTDGIGSVTMSGSKGTMNDGKLIDISGRQLRQKPQSGIFIKNGRKYVAD